MNSFADKFMKQFKSEGLTFDDISLLTSFSDFLPEEANTKSNFSRNIKMNVPLVSAAMDTVTEAEMAIAMACLGGVGVIHKNLSVEEQSSQVAKVKHYLNGFIKDPVVFFPEQTLEEMLDEKKRRRLAFSGFPIVDKENNLLGILTARDLKFVTDFQAEIADVMTEKLLTASDDTSLQKAFDIMLENKIGKLPTVDSEGKLTGLYSFHDVKTLIENMEPDYNRDCNHCLVVAGAVGPYDEERAESLVNAGVDVLVIDTAHGHSEGVIETVKLFRKYYGDKIDIVAGNIATGEAAVDLLDAGVDAVKVGVGPGSICTTRVVAGVGIPQITAIYEARKALGSEIPIIADGGIKQSGDIAKAIALGADSVMMGSALAGTLESPGEKIYHNGRRYVVYRGMGSVEAMKQGEGSRERYNQADVDDKKLVPQGIEGLVPFRGPVEDAIHQFVGGLKYSMGYCGTRNIPEMQQNSKFIRISGAGLREAHPHDVKIIKDAPNYMHEQ